MLGSILARDTALGCRIFAIGEAVKDDPPDIGLIVQNAAATIAMTADCGPLPRSPTWTRHSACIELVGNLHRTYAIGISLENPDYGSRLVGVDGSQPAHRLAVIVKLPPYPVTVTDASGDSAMLGDGLHTLARPVTNLLKHFLTEDCPQTQFHR